MAFPTCSYCLDFPPCHGVVGAEGLEYAGEVLKCVIGTHDAPPISTTSSAATSTLSTTTPRADVHTPANLPLTVTWRWSRIEASLMAPARTLRGGHDASSARYGLAQKHGVSPLSSIGACLACPSSQAAACIFRTP